MKSHMQKKQEREEAKECHETFFSLTYFVAFLLACAAVLCSLAALISVSAGEDEWASLVLSQTAAICLAAFLVLQAVRRVAWGVFAFQLRFSWRKVSARNYPGKVVYQAENFPDGFRLDGTEVVKELWSGNKSTGRCVLCTGNENTRCRDLSSWRTINGHIVAL